MEAKEAVAAAKNYFKEAFLEDTSLEEIWFEDGVWCVTLGVRRRPNSMDMMALAHSLLAYKVVRIRDRDGVPISIKNRDGERAA
jgi:hypothetical protein